MANIVRDPDGHLWEERGGKWYEVGATRAGGMMAGAQMGQLEGAAVGAGDVVQGIGANVEKGIATLLGDKERVKRIDEARAEQVARFEGAQRTGPGAAMMVGGALPSLATLPVGLGVGGLASRGLVSLAEQVGLGGGMGALTSSKSGDQGLDAMVGALLGAGGWGTGQLAGKVMGVIQDKGIRARMAVQEGLEAQAGGRLGAGGMGPPAPFNLGGTVEPSAEEVMRFGAAARPGMEELMRGGGLPGQVAGSPGLTREQARQLGRLDELGFEVTPGTRSGSLPQQQMEAAWQRAPYTSGAFEGMFKRNRDKLNQYAVRAIGEEGSELSPMVLDAAHSRIGNVMNAAGEVIGTVKAGDEVLQSASEKLRGIIKEAGEGASVVPEVEKAAARLLGIWEDAGQITGKRLMRERGRLVQRARQYSNDGDQLAADGIRDVIGAIDDVAASAMPEFGRATLAEVRAQYRTLATLENAGVIDAGGNVQTGALYRGLVKEFPLEMRRGVRSTEFGKTQTGIRAGDLMDITRGAQTFKSVIPDSGTATGMAMQGLQGTMLEKVLGGAIRHTLGRAYLGAPGRIGTELGQAENVVPALGGGGGGVARGLMGLVGY